MAGIVISFDAETGKAVVSSSAPARSQKGESLVCFPHDYVVIDIETTGLDPHFDSIIELAGIKYVDGVETGRFQTLVNPGFDIPCFITDLTGITNEMLRDAPTLSTALPKYRDFLGSCIVVGHNVHFDVNFLYDNSIDLGLPPFSNNLVDTMRLSRRLYKDLPDHKLSTVAKHLGISDTVEHRALADCLVAHKCLSEMESFSTQIGGIPETAAEQHSRLSKLITAETDVFDPDSPIYGKSFAFTGTLDKMTRKEAMQAVVNAGGICCDGVVATTNYLVLGNNDYCKSIKDGKSNKQKKAEKMQLNGFDIATISEDVFLDMLNA